MRSALVAAAFAVASCSGHPCFDVTICRAPVWHEGAWTCAGQCDGMSPNGQAELGEHDLSTIGNNPYCIAGKTGKYWFTGGWHCPYACSWLHSDGCKSPNRGDGACFSWKCDPDHMRFQPNENGMGSAQVNLANQRHLGESHALGGTAVDYATNECCRPGHATYKGPQGGSTEMMLGSMSTDNQVQDAYPGTTTFYTLKDNEACVTKKGFTTFVGGDTSTDQLVYFAKTSCTTDYTSSTSVWASRSSVVKCYNLWQNGAACRQRESGNPCHFCFMHDQGTNGAHRTYCNQIELEELVDMAGCSRIGPAIQ